jgi:hypothetical protein
MTLDELADFALQGASLCILAAGDAKPVFIIERADGGVWPFLTLWHDEPTRKVALMAAREVMATCKAVAYAHAYEAWTLPPIEPGTPLPTPRPREHADRIDSLIVDCHNLAGERLTIVAKIETADGLRAVGDVIMRERGCKTDVGDLVNLLLPEPPQESVH